MSDLRVISCLEAEAILFERSPLEVSQAVKAAGDGAADELAAHLGRCEACASLASDLALLSPLATLPPVAPSVELVEATFQAAARETRVLAQGRRRAAVAAGVKVALVFLLCLPLLAAWNAGVVALGAEYLGDVLPSGALYYLGGVYGLAAMGGLSALVFLLTLVAGAAAHPPLPDELAEA